MRIIPRIRMPRREDDSPMAAMERRNLAYRRRLRAGMTPGISDRPRAEEPGQGDADRRGKK